VWCVKVTRPQRLEKAGAIGSGRVWIWPSYCITGDGEFFPVSLCCGREETAVFGEWMFTKGFHSNCIIVCNCACTHNHRYLSITVRPPNVNVCEVFDSLIVILDDAGSILLHSVFPPVTIIIDSILLVAVHTHKHTRTRTHTSTHSSRVHDRELCIFETNPRIVAKRIDDGENE